MTVPAMEEDEAAPAPIIPLVEEEKEESSSANTAAATIGLAAAVAIPSLAATVL